MLDLIAQVDVAPERGETVLGQRLDTQPGGKGFNQAIAAARLGCSVEFVSRLGDDAHDRGVHGGGRRDGAFPNASG